MQFFYPWLVENINWKPTAKEESWGFAFWLVTAHGFIGALAFPIGKYFQNPSKCILIFTILFSLIKDTSHCPLNFEASDPTRHFLTEKMIFHVGEDKLISRTHISLGYHHTQCLVPGMPQWEPILAPASIDWPLGIRCSMSCWAPGWPSSHGLCSRAFPGSGKDRLRLSICKTFNQVLWISDLLGQMCLYKANPLFLPFPERLKILAVVNLHSGIVASSWDIAAPLRWASVSIRKEYRPAINISCADVNMLLNQSGSHFPHL